MLKKWGAIVFYFFYFYDELYYIPDIQQAFKNVCLDKMLTDGYFDMNAYISGRLKKDSIYANLAAAKSKYARLYKSSYPKKENAANIWRSKIGDSVGNETGDNAITLSYEESVAIVNWVYRAMSTAKEREEFTKELFSRIKELHGVSNTIYFSNGIAYNSKFVDVYFISSVSDMTALLSGLKLGNNTLFYRGHSDPNYTLQPSIMRTAKLHESESKIYNELIIECPADFENCHSHLEKLVKMQHYGLPTRLLDVTRNPLVALFFACENHTETYGELVLISADINAVKYPQSDTVSILASLPAFSYEKQQIFLKLAMGNATNDVFNEKISRLIQEIRLEKPAFQAEIRKEDLLDSCVIYALKNNSRIVKQDGAFILCGLNAEKGALENYRYRENGKKIVVIVDKKKEILKQLENLSINRASLFPEVECVAEYLTKKYS